MSMYFLIFLSLSLSTVVRPLLLRLFKSKSKHSWPMPHTAGSVNFVHHRRQIGMRLQDLCLTCSTVIIEAMCAIKQSLSLCFCLACLHNVLVELKSENLKTDLCRLADGSHVRSTIWPWKAQVTVFTNHARQRLLRPILLVKTVRSLTVASGGIENTY